MTSPKIFFSFGVSMLAIAGILSILYLQEDGYDKKVSVNTESIDEDPRYTNQEIENAVDLVASFKGENNSGVTLNQSFFQLMNLMNNQNITEEDYYKYSEWQGGTFSPSSNEIMVLFVWGKTKSGLNS